MPKMKPLTKAERLEYTRLRDIAQKRLKRLPSVKSTPYRTGTVPKLRDLQARQVRRELNKLRRWVRPNIPARYNPNTLSGKHAEKRKKQAPKKEVIPRATRHEFSKLKQEVEFNVKMFKRAGETEASFYQEFAGHIPKISELTRLEAELEIIHMRQELAKDTATLEGHLEARDFTVNYMQAAGYDFIDMSNVDAFGRFMDYYHNVEKSRTYDSTQAVDLFKWAVTNKIAPDLLMKRFQEYLYLQENNIMPQPFAGGTSSAEARAILGE